jgi:hypothetical protein
MFGDPRNFGGSDPTNELKKQFCAHICANLHKYWNNAMSNDGLSTEIIDKSDGD